MLIRAGTSGGVFLCPVSRAGTLRGEAARVRAPRPERVNTTLEEKAVQPPKGKESLPLCSEPEPTSFLRVWCFPLHWAWRGREQPPGSQGTPQPGLARGLEETDTFPQ